MATLIEIAPRKNILRRAYLNTMLWFLGRAVQAASRVDPEVKKEFEAMPEPYTFALGAFPAGPWMVVGRDDQGRARYLGRHIEKQPVHLKLTFKGTAVFFLLLSFQESSPVATAQDRMIVDGDVPQACAAVRILDIVQVYLLPKFVAKMAIKRYPAWTWKRHTIDRAKVYIRTITGF